MTRFRRLLFVALVVAGGPAPARSRPDGFSLPAGCPPVRQSPAPAPEWNHHRGHLPDGKLLATASYDGVVVWDLKT